MDSMLKIGFTDLFEPQQMGFEPFLKKNAKKYEKVKQCLSGK